MPANSSLILTNLDFDSLKNTFKSYLKAQDKFADYDFDGSNISVLLDLLAYNTYLNSFYLNMVASEMFLDTATLRDSVVSHAKELNYTPRSFKSAVATVDLTLTDTDTSRQTVVIPKGQSFTARIGSNTFTFTVPETVTSSELEISGNTIIFTVDDLDIYEGDYLSDVYTVNFDNPVKYIITNKNVDISSITVTVIEDVGATVHEYSRATSLFDLDEDSKVFFVQSGPNSTYEVIFGDGVVGRPPKDNSLVVVEYRVSNGELPNGAFQFQSDNTIDGISNVSISVVTAAHSGAISESIDSIKYNAPRHFTTQERAITTEDYATLLTLNFPEINDVNAYGGEDANPPQYGRVFISVDLNDVDGLPLSKKAEYYSFLKPRSPVSIDPVFVDPEYMYVACTAVVNYNINVTNLNPEDIKTLVIDAIKSYASEFLDGFNKTLRYSKLMSTIDNTHNAIVSNELKVQTIRYLTPTLNTIQNLEIKFHQPLDPILPDTSTYPTSDFYTIWSTPFVYNGQRCRFVDDGLGEIHIVTVSNASVVATVGSVNYDAGTVSIENIEIDDYDGAQIKVYGTPRSKDIFSQHNTILNIVESDITVTVTQVRE